MQASPPPFAGIVDGKTSSTIPCGLAIIGAGKLQSPLEVVFGDDHMKLSM
jgi:hypothetical protein